MKQFYLALMLCFVSIATFAYNEKSMEIKGKCEDGTTYRVLIHYHTLIAYANGENVEVMRTGEVEKTDTLCVEAQALGTMQNTELKQYNKAQRAKCSNEFLNSPSYLASAGNRKQLQEIQDCNDWLVRSYKIPSIISVALGGITTITGVAYFIKGNETVGASLFCSGATCVALGSWGIAYSKKLRTKFDAEMNLYMNGLSITF